jgi:hypothetical protein
MKKKSIEPARYRPPVPLVRGPRNNIKERVNWPNWRSCTRLRASASASRSPTEITSAMTSFWTLGKRFWRVQVRSTSGIAKGRSCYIVASRRGHSPNFKAYQAGEIDFFVVYIVPLDIWYVVPIGEIGALHYLRLYPSGCRIGGFFESYREAWHLMAPGGDVPRPGTLRRVRTIDLHRKFFVE